LKRKDTICRKEPNFITPCMKESPSLSYSKNIQEYEPNNNKYRSDSLIYEYKSYTAPKSIQVIELITEYAPLK